MSKPNFLLITTDQQRFDTIAALGNPYIFTPHLNWLADEGIAFTRCYSDCPVCMPARATIMTGLTGFHHGLVGNAENVLPMKDRPTLPGLLTASGYQTRAEGKLHFAPMRTTYGIEHADLPMDYFNEMRRYGRPSTRMHGIGENEMEPAINTIPENDTLTHWIVDKSIDFLENRDTTRPFFLWTSFTKPHPPFDPSLAYWELYRNMELPEPVIGDWACEPGTPPNGFYKPTLQLNRIERFSSEHVLQAKRAYYACISQIDYNLGLLFARMRELNLLENTWIFFTSDHGELLGDHYMGAKSIFLEGSNHIPLLIKPPSKFGTSHPIWSELRCNKLVTLADIMPTILSLANIQIPENLDGQNLLSYISNDDEQTIIGDCEHCYLSVIRGWYKYTWSRLGGDELLFDLKNDPWELHNLSHSNDFQILRNDLRRILVEHAKNFIPDTVEDDDLIAQPGIKNVHIPRFPGLNTTIFPRDSFH